MSFSSFTFPPTTYKYHLDRDELEVYHEFPVQVDTQNMTAQQVWFTSKDGTRVPMFVVHRKDVVLDGNNPTLLTGYGGFDVSMRPGFSTTYLVWLEAGGVLAVANLRGGGEFGREWHEAGMKEKKQNCFDDFIAAAEWLIANGWTSPAKLAIRGGSNGGLLVGACLVQRPDLFRAVLCEVPLLDMVNYHRFGLANIWAEEYGSSDDPAQFAYLRAYSPYHNLVAGRSYPAFLCTGSENDARVDPLHARKMVARLQELDPRGRAAPAAHPAGERPRRRHDHHHPDPADGRGRGVPHGTPGHAGAVLRAHGRNARQHHPVPGPRLAARPGAARRADPGAATRSGGCCNSRGRRPSGTCTWPSRTRWAGRIGTCTGSRPTTR